jgi:hypothetical protein
MLPHATVAYVGVSSAWIAVSALDPLEQYPIKLLTHTLLLLFSV